MAERLDIDLLDDEDPFEIDEQAPHLFKHAGLGIDDAYDVWRSDPLFYPAKRPAHWLMVSEVVRRWWSRWRRRILVISPGADRSVATPPPITWPGDTGRIDDRKEDDPGRRVPVLCQAREPGATGSTSAAPVEADGTSACTFPS